MKSPKKKADLRGAQHEKNRNMGGKKMSKNPWQGMNDMKRKTEVLCAGQRLTPHAANGGKFPILRRSQKPATRCNVTQAARTIELL